MLINEVSGNIFNGDEKNGNTFWSADTNCSFFVVPQTKLYFLTRSILCLFLAYCVCEIYNDLIKYLQIAGSKEN